MQPPALSTVLPLAPTSYCSSHYGTSIAQHCFWLLLLTDLHPPPPGGLCMQLFRLHAAQEHPAEGCAPMGVASVQRKECFPHTLIYTKAPALQVVGLRGTHWGSPFSVSHARVIELVAACPASQFLEARTMLDLSLFPRS